MCVWTLVHGIARKNGTDQKEEPIIEIGTWDSNSVSNIEWKELSIDLTKYVTRIGQYEVTFVALNNNDSGLEFRDLELEMYGGKSINSIELLKGSSTFRITRSQQTLDEFPTILRLKIKSKSEKTSGNITVKRLMY